jgi:multidrug efflux pump subunit AcrA (membrane-fusion protein)
MRIAGPIAVALTALACGCRNPPPPAIELSLGEEEPATRLLVPRSAWAEQLVIPGVRSELRIVLASGAAACDSYRPPEEDEVRLTITVTGPADQPLGPGIYAWTDAAAPTEPGKPAPRRAFPKVLVGDRAFQLPPGGGLELQRVEPPPRGIVAGVIGFAFPGGANAPATSIKGSFEARTCTATGPARP